MDEEGGDRRISCTSPTEMAGGGRGAGELDAMTCKERAPHTATASSETWHVAWLGTRRLKRGKMGRERRWEHRSAMVSGSVHVLATEEASHSLKPQICRTARHACHVDRPPAHGPLFSRGSTAEVFCAHCSPVEAPSTVNSAFSQQAHSSLHLCAALDAEIKPQTSW